MHWWLISLHVVSHWHPVLHLRSIAPAVSSWCPLVSPPEAIPYCHDSLVCSVVLSHCWRRQRLRWIQMRMVYWMTMRSICVYDVNACSFVSCPWGILIYETIIIIESTILVNITLWHLTLMMRFIFWHRRKSLMRITSTSLIYIYIFQMRIPIGLVRLNFDDTIPDWFIFLYVYTLINVTIPST